MITVEKIIELKENRKKFYQSKIDLQKEWDDYYEGTYDAGIPTGLSYAQKTPSTARDWVEIGLRYFTLDNPKVVVPPVNETQKALEQAIMLEAFYNFWAKLCILQVKLAAKKLLLRGEAFLKLGFDDTTWGKTANTEDEKLELAAQQLIHFPLIMQVPDPINVMCSPVHRGLVPLDVIEYYPRTVSEVEELCEQNKWRWQNSKSKKSNDLVNWTAYYDDKVRCFMVEDEPILSPAVQVNIMKRCPYVHIPSGFGNTSFEGKPEYLYRPVFYGKKDAINLQTRVLSQLDAILTRFAYPRPVIEEIEPGALERAYGAQVRGQKTLTMEMNPEQAWLIPPGLKVTLMQGEQPPPALFQHAALVSSLAQVPAVLSGERPAGIYSGYGVESLVAGAKPIYKDALKNMEEGLSVFFGEGVRFADEVIRERIPIRGTSSKEEKFLEPSKIKGYYFNEVHLLAEPPEAVDVRKTLGTNLYKSGVISLKTCLTQYLDMTNEEADGELAQLYAEAAIKSNPNVMQVLGIDAAQRLGMERVAELESEGIPTMEPNPPAPPVNLGAEGVPQYQRRSAALEHVASPRERKIEGLPIG